MTTIELRISKCHQGNYLPSLLEPYQRAERAPVLGWSRGYRPSPLLAYR